MSLVPPDKVSELLVQELRVINLGLEEFARNLQRKNVAVVHVQWRPPALGDDDLLRLLDKLR